jgi:hypothetical protein
MSRDVHASYRGKLDIDEIVSQLLKSETTVECTNETIPFHAIIRRMETTIERCGFVWFARWQGEGHCQRTGNRTIQG